MATVVVSKDCVTEIKRKSGKSDFIVTIPDETIKKYNVELAEEQLRLAKNNVGRKIYYASFPDGIFAKGIITAYSTKTNCYSVHWLEKLEKYSNFVINDDMKFSVEKENVTYFIGD